MKYQINKNYVEIPEGSTHVLHGTNNNRTYFQLFSKTKSGRKVYWCTHGDWELVDEENHYLIHETGKKLPKTEYRLKEPDA